jgi:FtsH-binding integral membrane protein
MMKSSHTTAGFSIFSSMISSCNSPVTGGVPNDCSLISTSTVSMSACSADPSGSPDASGIGSDVVVVVVAAFVVVVVGAAVVVVTTTGGEVSTTGASVAFGVVVAGSVAGWVVVVATTGGSVALVVVVGACVGATGATGACGTGDLSHNPHVFWQSF